MNTTEKQTLRARGRLVAVKILHTVVWAFFVACILAIPVAGWVRRFDWAVALTALILLECAVLAVNRCRCPLTGVAAQYTPDRSPNFDIYLPGWVAKHNKAVFGIVFCLNEFILLWQWLH